MGPKKKATIEKEKEEFKDSDLVVEHTLERDNELIFKTFLENHPRAVPECDNFMLENAISKIKDDALHAVCGLDQNLLRHLSHNAKVCRSYLIFAFSRLKLSGPWLTISAACVGLLSKVGYYGKGFSETHIKTKTELVWRTVNARCAANHLFFHGEFMKNCLEANATQKIPYFPDVVGSFDTVPINVPDTWWAKNTKYGCVVGKSFAGCLNSGFIVYPSNYVVYQGNSGDSTIFDHSKLAQERPPGSRWLLDGGFEWMKRYPSWCTVPYDAVELEKLYESGGVDAFKKGLSTNEAIAFFRSRIEHRFGEGLGLAKWSAFDDWPLHNVKNKYPGDQLSEAMVAVSVVHNMNIYLRFGYDGCYKEKDANRDMKALQQRIIRAPTQTTRYHNLYAKFVEKKTDKEIKADAKKREKENKQLVEKAVQRQHPLSHSIGVAAGNPVVLEMTEDLQYAIRCHAMMKMYLPCLEKRILNEQALYLFLEAPKGVDLLDPVDFLGPHMNPVHFRLSLCKFFGWSDNEVKKGHTSNRLSWESVRIVHTPNPYYESRPIM